MLRHVADDPVRAVTLAWRALPAPLRGWLRLAGPYGRAAALWGAGDRRGALTALEGSPARLAAFSLAVDQPAVARSALARLSEHNSPPPRLRRPLLAELPMLDPGALPLGAPSRPALAAAPGPAFAGRGTRVLHIV